MQTSHRSSAALPVKLFCSNQQLSITASSPNTRNERSADLFLQKLASWLFLHSLAWCPPCFTPTVSSPSGWHHFRFCLSRTKIILCREFAAYFFKANLCVTIFKSWYNYNHISYCNLLLFCSFFFCIWNWRSCTYTSRIRLVPGRGFLPQMAFCKDQVNSGGNSKNITIQKHALISCS